MKIIILSSNNYGTASHHLQYLIADKTCEISMVILNEGVVTNKFKHYKRKIKKILKIGILGALNGIRMRKWFSDDINKLQKQIGLEDICSNNNIPFYKTPQINCTYTKELFQKANADLAVSLGNGYIGKNIFTIPKFGMINIHHEILPDYQNAQSVIWQIYNMSSTTGYTIHKIDKSIDTGEILHQEHLPILFKKTFSETVSQTTQSLINASAIGLAYVIKHFEELNLHSKKQLKGNSYTTPSIWQFIRIIINFNKLKRKNN